MIRQKCVIISFLQSAIVWTGKNPENFAISFVGSCSPVLLVFLSGSVTIFRQAKDMAQYV